MNTKRKAHLFIRLILRPVYIYRADIIQFLTLRQKVASKLDAIRGVQRKVLVYCRKRALQSTSGLHAI